MKSVEHKRIVDEVFALSAALDAKSVENQKYFNSATLFVIAVFAIVSTVVIYFDISLTSPLGLVAILFFLLCLVVAVFEVSTNIRNVFSQGEMTNKLLAGIFDVYADFESRKNKT
jgi:hypothetical protein